jgi:chitodextrinase
MPLALARKIGPRTGSRPRLEVAGPGCVDSDGADKPGDPNGPWEQIATAADGTAIWTPSRVFTTGDVVVYQGEKYVAKWWTRNQAPVDPNGPWQPAS